MAGFGKWLRTTDGGLVALHHIDKVYVRAKDGPREYEVEARTVSGGKATLFEHKDEQICREWLRKLAWSHLNMVPEVVLTRRCPECRGTGWMPGPDPDSKEPCPLCEGEREVSLQTYEAHIEAMEVFGGSKS